MYNWGIRDNEIIKFYFSQVQHNKSKLLKKPENDISVRKKTDNQAKKFSTNLVKAKLEPRAYVTPIITMDNVDIKPVDPTKQDSEIPIEKKTVTQPHTVIHITKEKVTFIYFYNIVRI